MSANGRSAQPSVTPAVESAGFVRLVTSADGDGLAASGLLARALAVGGTPFQVTVGSTIAARTDRAQAASADDELTLAIGAVDADVPRLDGSDRPATLVALEIARALEATPDPVLALAGLVAAGVTPGAGESEWLLEAAEDRKLVDRRPGVAVPTADVADGLAHSTRVDGPWSGDVDAVGDALEELGIESSGDHSDGDHRAIASLVALEVVGTEDATTHAASAIARMLKPYETPEGHFETVGGYADVLEAAARVEPGTAVALAMGHDAREPALTAWRRHGRRAHEALESASTGRYDGLFVLGFEDGPVETVARLAAEFRSPEPAVLAIGSGETALVTRDGISASMVERIARELESAEEISPESIEYDAGRNRGYLRYEPTLEEDTIIERVRAVL